MHTAQMPVMWSRPQYNSCKKKQNTRAATKLASGCAAGTSLSSRDKHEDIKMYKVRNYNCAQSIVVLSLSLE